MNDYDPDDLPDEYDDEEYDEPEDDLIGRVGGWGDTRRLRRR